MTKYSKAIIAGLSFLAVAADTFFGVNLGLDEGMISAIAAAIGTVLVYFVPNTD
jgi:hypothetical protein